MEIKRYKALTWPIEIDEDEDIYALEENNRGEWCKYADVEKLVKSWWGNYVGLCQEVFGVNNGEINFPPHYECQTESIFKEMEKIIKI